MKKILIVPTLLIAMLVLVTIYNNINNTEASSNIDRSAQNIQYEEEKYIEVDGFRHKLIDYMLTKNIYDFGDFYEYDYRGALNEFSDDSGMMTDPDKSWLFFTLEIKNVDREPKVYNIGNIVFQGLDEKNRIIHGYFGEVWSYDKGSSNYNMFWFNRTYKAGERQIVRVAALMLDEEIQKIKNLAIIPYIMNIGEIDRAEYFILDKLDFSFIANKNGNVEPQTKKTEEDHNEYIKRIGDTFEIKLTKTMDTGEKFIDTFEITANELRVFYSKNNLISSFNLDRSIFDDRNDMQKDDDKAFYLVSMEIENTGDNDFNVAEIPFQIRGGYSPFEKSPFLFKLLNEGKETILKNGEKREFIYPFIFFEGHYSFDEKFDIKNIDASMGIKGFRDGEAIIWLN